MPCIEAHRSADTEGDFFIFSYSTDGTAYTDMLIAGSETDFVKKIELPDTISGQVYIRDVDADRTKGHRSLGTLYIDQMHIESVIDSSIPQ